MRIKMLRDDIPTPKRAHKTDAGLDLVSANTITVNPGEVVFASTGVAVAIPQNHVGLLFPRSGMASKKRITLANNVGVIDSDYRGEVKAALVNESGSPVTIEAGTRIVQLVVAPILLPEIEIVDELDETTRGAGGFGSTGMDIVPASIRDILNKRIKDEQLDGKIETLVWRSEQPGMRMRPKDTKAIGQLSDFCYDAERAISLGKYDSSDNSIRARMREATIEADFDIVDVLASKYKTIKHRIAD